MAENPEFAKMIVDRIREGIEQTKQSRRPWVFPILSGGEYVRVTVEVWRP